MKLVKATIFNPFQKLQTKFLLLPSVRVLVLNLPRLTILKKLIKSSKERSKILKEDSRVQSTKLTLRKWTNQAALALWALQVFTQDFATHSASGLMNRYSGDANM